MTEAAPVRAAKPAAAVTTRMVAEDEAEMRLDRWLRRHHPHLTQGAIEKFCRTGQVRVDGARVAANTRLAAGQSVRIPPLPAAPAPRAPRPLDEGAARDLAARILYRDDSVIVLNKPSGLPVQGGPGIVKHVDGLLDGLRFGAEDRPRLVHRLDRDTSGLLVLARTPAAAARLAAAFRGRRVQKTYWAVVAGRPVPAAGTIDAALVKAADIAWRRMLVAEPEDEDAADARTDYETLDAAGKKFSLLALRPHTGRTHQLRVHAASLGTPILGDPKYADRETHPEGLPDRLHLHARRLVLPHPEGGTLTVEADLPPHMRESFAALGFDAPAPARPRRAG